MSFIVQAIHGAVMKKVPHKEVTHLYRGLWHQITLCGYNHQEDSQVRLSIYLRNPGKSSADFYDRWCKDCRARITDMDHINAVDL